MNQKDEDLWELTTWDGVRRGQLRRALEMTVRERLEALEEMSELALHFEWMRETGRFRSPAGEG